MAALSEYVYRVVDKNGERIAPSGHDTVFIRASSAKARATRLNRKSEQWGIGNAAPGYPFRVEKAEVAAWEEL